MQALKGQQYRQGETYWSSKGAGREREPVSGEDILEQYGGSQKRGTSIFRLRHTGAVGVQAVKGTSIFREEILEQYRVRH